MKKFLLVIFTLLNLFAVEAAKPIKIIFDTDMGNDVDDVTFYNVIATIFENVLQR